MKRKGSSLIESALALTMLVMVTLAMVDTGRYLYAANLMPYLAREGARFAMLRPEVEAVQVRDHVRKLAAGLPPESIQVELSRENKPAAITVRTSWIFTPATGVLSRRSAPVSGQARLLCP